MLTWGFSSITCLPFYTKITDHISRISVLAVNDTEMVFYLNYKD